MSGYEEPYRLAISDGEMTVELTHGPFFVKEWLPASTAYKGGGVWQSSPLADGRSLVSRQFENVNETIQLTLSTNTPDGAIRAVNDLFTLLERAADYGSFRWAETPVYLIAQGRAETNTRYAQVFAGRVPQGEQPQGILWKLGQLGRRRAVWESVDLVVEHGLWQSTAPATAECGPLRVRPDLLASTYLSRLEELGAMAVWPQNEASGTVINNVSHWGSDLDGEYNGTPIYSDPGLRVGETAIFYSLGSAAGDIYSTRLNDLFDGSYVRALLWIRTSGVIWTSGFEHYFLKLYSDANNSLVVKKTATDNEIQVIYRVGGKEAIATISGVADTEWFSLYVWANEIFLNPGSSTKIVRIYKDGIFQDSGSFTFAGSWTAALDSNNCILGANALSGTNSSSTNINWAVLFDTGPGHTTQDILDISTNPVDVLAETNCDGEVLLSNKRTFAPLTHMYTHDGSFSSNLVNAATPHDLFPDPAGSGDITYFGVQSGGALPYGPFDNLALFIETGGEGSYTVTWEYWNGAWVTLTVTDNTTLGSLVFGSEGFSSVHWIVPDDWATTAVNGITGYWVRARISAFTSMTAVPQQGTRNVYTSIVNFLDVPSLGGTIPALARLRLVNQSDQGGGPAPYLFSNQLLIGARSLKRGENFESMINVSDQQVPAGVSFATGLSSFAADNTPTGRSLSYAPGTAFPAVPIAALYLDEALTGQYSGRFSLFVNVETDTLTNSVFEFYVDVIVATGGGSKRFFPDKNPTTSGNYWLSFGQVYLESGKLKRTEPVDRISFTLSGASSAIATVKTRMFALIPTDEITMRLKRGTGATAVIVKGQYWDIDSVLYPQVTRGVARDVASDSVNQVFQLIGDSLHVSAQDRVRLHVLATYLNSSGDLLQFDALSHSAQLEVAKRYHLMRGDE